MSIRDMNHYTEQFERYSNARLATALADCYETLRIVAACGNNASVTRVWAQIDAIRDIQTSRGEKAKQ